MELLANKKNQNMSAVYHRSRERRIRSSVLTCKEKKPRDKNKFSWYHSTIENDTSVQSSKMRSMFPTNRHELYI